jgi:hypothetical protein
MVMKYMQLWIILAFAPLAACATTQTATEKQAQMDAADVRQSSANVPAYETPYLAFIAYYNSMISYDLVNMIEAMTEEAKEEAFSGNVPTNQEAITIGQALQQEGHSGHAIDLFYYTDNLQSPQIKATISSVHDQLRGTEEMTLTFTDTAGGWKISNQVIVSKGKTPVQP